MCFDNDIITFPSPVVPRCLVSSGNFQRLLIVGLPRTRLLLVACRVGFRGHGFPPANVRGSFVLHPGDGFRFAVVKFLVFVLKRLMMIWKL